MELKYISNGSTLQFDRDKCTGCGMCLEVCPHNVVSMVKGKAVFTRRDLCMECGACMMNCPAGAVSVRAGVGCAYAVLASYFKKSTTPGCGCGTGCCD